MSFSPTEPKPPESSADGKSGGSPRGRVEVTLPELGEETLEAIVVAWEKYPRDEVAQGETICIVSAAGMRAAIASSASGQLTRLLAGVGTRVEPGVSLAEIETREAVAEEDGPSDFELDVDEWVEEVAATSPPPEEPTVESGTAPADGPAGGGPFYSPAVRRIAREHGLDLARVEGRGSGGRVRKEDVVAHLAARRAGSTLDAAGKSTK